MKKNMVFLILFTSFLMNANCITEKTKYNLSSENNSNSIVQSNENYLADVNSHSFATSDIQNIYIKANLEWKSPPKEVAGGYTYTDSVDLLLFFTSGEFAIVSGTLNRYSKEKKYSFCQGCGYSIRKGTWKRENSIVTITFNYVYENIPVERKTAPESEVRELLTLAGELKNKNSSIIVSENKNVKTDDLTSMYLPDGKYIPLTNLNNIDFLLNIINLGSKN